MKLGEGATAELSKYMKVAAVLELGREKLVFLLGSMLLLPAASSAQCWPTMILLFGADLVRSHRFWRFLFFVNIK